MVRAANAIITEIDIAIRGGIWNALAISDISLSPFGSSLASASLAFEPEPSSASAKEDSVARGRLRCDRSVLASVTLAEEKHLRL